MTIFLSYWPSPFSQFLFFLAIRGWEVCWGCWRNLGGWDQLNCWGAHQRRAWGVGGGLYIYCSCQIFLFSLHRWWGWPAIWKKNCDICCEWFCNSYWYYLFHKKILKYVYSINLYRDMFWKSPCYPLLSSFPKIRLYWNAEPSLSIQPHVKYEDSFFR